MISFIVPAYNEETELPGTLRAIHSAAVGYEYETVLVNDGSTDATAAIGEQFGARVTSIERRHIAAARNAGAKAARGDVFIFVDADTQIGPEHVRGAMEALENGFAGGGSRLGAGIRGSRGGLALLQAVLLVLLHVRLQRHRGRAQRTGTCSSRGKKVSTIQFQAIGQFFEHRCSSNSFRSVRMVACRAAPRAKHTM